MTTVTITRRMRAWLVAVAVFTPMMVTGMNVWYTNHVDDNSRERNQRQQQLADMRWCALFKLYVDPNQPPPTTDRGKQQLVAFTELYKSLGCK